jgi:D-aspartate ligase
MLSPAFVEGADVSAYGIARSLGRNGVNIFALHDGSSDLLRYSRYCRRCFVFPADPTQPHAYAGDLVPNEEVLCALMLDWAANLDCKPVLFATSDWFARLLANQRDRLAPRFLFHWISPELFATIADKGRMASVCERVRVRVPHTHVTTPDDDIAALSKSIPYPCIVKPLHRYTIGFPGPGKLFVARAPEALESFFNCHPALKGATLIQQMIEGGDDQIFQYTAFVGNSGHGAKATVRKLRQYRPGYGSMCYGRTEPNQAIIAEGSKLLDALQYRGLASLEFKYSASDNTYYFIEMNTRLPWYNGIFADAGINLAHLAYEDLTEGLSSKPPSQTDFVRWMSLRENRRWYKETLPARHKLLKWAGSVLTANSYAWWNWRDPLPFLLSGLLALRSVAGKIKRLRVLRREPSMQ